MSRVGAALLLALVAGCGGPPIPDDDVRLTVTAKVAEVGLGEGFSLSVVRAWRRDLVPAEWTDDALAPLQVRLLSTSRREDDRHVEETRRFRAHVFLPGDVTVRVPAFAARPGDGGPELSAACDPLRIRVRPSLDPADPGPPELPGGPLADPSPLAFWWVPGLLVLATLGFIAVRRRRASRRG